MTPVQVFGFKNIHTCQPIRDRLYPGSYGDQVELAAADAYQPVIIVERHQAVLAPDSSKKERRATTSSSAHSVVSVKPSVWYRCLAAALAG